MLRTATTKISMTAATDWEGLLNTGIAAYQQGDYARAIAILQNLSRCPSKNLRTKAGMGLVRTYMAQQQWAKARALCETIAASAHPAVQKWATDTLSKIETRSRRSPKAESLSGFTPLAASSANAKERELKAPKPQETKPQETKP